MNRTPRPLPLVYAITVNWNRPDVTADCIRSLLNQTYPNLRLLVIDNGSTDGSPEILAAQFPQVKLIANPKNLGFAGGYNSGMRQALQSGAEYVLIVNNDATLASNGIEILMRHISHQTGVLCPLIYYADFPEKVWSAGGKVSRWNLEKSSPFENSTRRGSWPETIEQDFVTGCCMLFPRNTLEKVGLFDESFQMYYEDSDLCYRIREHGFTIAVVPGAAAWHKVAASSGGGNSPMERYWMARSSIRFFRKHAHGLQWPVIGLWRTSSALRTTLRLVRLHKKQALRAYWRGLKDGLLDSNSGVLPGGQS